MLVLFYKTTPKEIELVCKYNTFDSKLRFHAHIDNIVNSLIQ